MAFDTLGLNPKGLYIILTCYVAMVLFFFYFMQEGKKSFLLAVIGTIAWAVVSVLILWGILSGLDYVFNKLTFRGVVSSVVTFFSIIMICVGNQDRSAGHKKFGIFALIIITIVGWGPMIVKMLK